MIETKDLILRKWKKEDLVYFAKINADEDVCKFLSKTLTKKESDQLAQKILDHFQKYGFGLFAVELKENNKFIGFIGLNTVDFEAPFSNLKNPKIEIGWRLDKDYWNLGYATQGAKAVLNFVKNNLELKELVSFTTKTNLASQKVMQKIGMTYTKSHL